MCVIFVRFRCAFVIRKKEKKGVQKKKKDDDFAGREKKPIVSEMN